MSESYIQNLFADRIGGSLYGKGTAIYKFEKIKRAKRAALTANPGAEIIDMGVGEPDEMAFRNVVRQLHEEAKKPDNRGYADNGDAVLKEAAARYLDRVCGVPGINPATEVIHSIGSKAALSILPAALIQSGDPLKAFPLAVVVAYDRIVRDDLMYVENGDHGRQAIGALLYRSADLDLGAYGVSRTQRDASITGHSGKRPFCLFKQTTSI